MKTKNALAVLLIAAFIPLGLAGCGTENNGGQSNTNRQGNQTNTTQQPTQQSTKPKAQTKIVSKPDQFVSLYMDWTKKIEAIAVKNDKLYADWSSKKITRSKYNDGVDALRKELSKLNNSIELKTEFKLDKAGKQKVKYEEITTDYTRVAKDLNDFLYVAPHLQDPQLKTKYQEVIKRDYKNHLAELKGLLNSVK